MDPILSSLPGIDAAAALDRMSGNERLYKKALGMFVDLAARQEEDILAAQNRKDWRALHRAAHTIKGLAGTIGAVELFQLALDLERDIKGQEPNWPLVEPKARNLCCSLASVGAVIRQAGL
jgi:HPt (histidine-containing phosphotransfer) domain-containing protein